MKKIKSIVQEVDPIYVHDDCLQMMMAYKDYLLLLGNGNILYRDIPGYDYINEYLNDERREEFPYSNIPKHKKKVMLQTFDVTNQLLEYETPYLRLSGSFSSILYALKDNNKAYIVNDFLASTKITEEDVTREELDELFAYSNDHLKIFKYNNNWGNSLKLPTNEEILDMFKEEAKHYIKVDSANLYIQKALKHIIDNASYSSIIEDYKFCEDDILVVESSSDKLSINLISIRFMGEDKYKIIKKEVPINKYTLDYISTVDKKIKLVKEPDINLRLNKDLTKKDIEKAKSLILR